MTAAGTRRVLEDPADVEFTAHALADGAVVGHPFGNVYALSARPTPESVRRLNRLLGDAPDRLGCLVTTRPRVPTVFDWARLPRRLSRPLVTSLVDRLLGLGPCGFRGPAAPHLPGCLATWDGEVRTTLLIAPGYACPSNVLLGRAMQLLGTDYLCTTPTAPATSADGLRPLVAGAPDVLLLTHLNDASAAAAYPLHAPGSPTVVAFHRLGQADLDGRPRLLIERAGSLDQAALDREMQSFGWRLVWPAPTHPYGDGATEARYAGGP